MSGLRKHFFTGLVLLMCVLTDHCGESAPSTAPAAAAAPGDARQDLRRMVEIVKHVEESRGRHGSKAEPPLTSRVISSPAEQKTDRGNQVVGESSSLMLALRRAE